MNRFDIITLCFVMLCVLCVLCTHCEKSIYGSRRHHVQLQCYYSRELFVTFPIYAFFNDELKIWNLLNERKERFNVYLCFGLSLSFAWPISALLYLCLVLSLSCSLLNLCLAPSLSYFICFTLFLCQSIFLLYLWLVSF